MARRGPHQFSGRKKEKRSCAGKSLLIGEMWARLCCRSKKKKEKLKFRMLRALLPEEKPLKFATESKRGSGRSDAHEEGKKKRSASTGGCQEERLQTACVDGGKKVHFQYGTEERSWGKRAPQYFSREKKKDQRSCKRRNLGKSFRNWSPCQRRGGN